VGFRWELHRCFTAGADVLFELADAVLCADGPVRTFLVPVGAMLGAITAGSVPNSAWLMDVATARRSPSTAAGAAKRSALPSLDPSTPRTDSAPIRETGTNQDAPHSLV
jgi:hypothetical protein